MYMKRHQTLQADYHNLLSITSELVGALASSLNGQQIRPEYVESVLERLQIFRRKSSAPQICSPKHLNFEKIKQSLYRDERLQQLLLHALRMVLIS